MVMYSGALRNALGACFCQTSVFLWLCGTGAISRYRQSKNFRSEESVERCIVSLLLSQPSVPCAGAEELPTLLVAGTPVQVGVWGSAQKAASSHPPAASVSHLFGSVQCYY